MTVKQIIKTVFGVVGLLFALSIIFGATTTVPQGSVGVYLRFGKSFPDALAPGFHTKFPFVDDIRLMPVTISRYDSGELNLKSKDSQEVHAKITLNYHIASNFAVYLYGKVAGDDSEINSIIIQPVVPGKAGESFADFTIDQLVASREGLVKDLKQRLVDDLGKQGLIVDDVNITDFNFSTVYNNSIENKVTTEQAKITAQLTLDKETISAQIQVVNANAAANALVAQAKGEADAEKLRAQGDASAIKIRSDALQSASDKYIPYVIATRWNGQTPVVSSVPGTNNIINVPSLGQK
jgi:prohibitin 2